MVFSVPGHGAVFMIKTENKLGLCAGLLCLPILSRLGVREPACLGPLNFLCV